MRRPIDAVCLPPPRASRGAQRSEQRARLIRWIGTLDERSEQAREESERYPDPSRASIPRSTHLCLLIVFVSGVLLACWFHLSARLPPVTQARARKSSFQPSDPSWLLLRASLPEVVSSLDTKTRTVAIGTHQILRWTTSQLSQGRY